MIVEWVGKRVGIDKKKSTPSSTCRDGTSWVWSGLLLLEQCTRGAHEAAIGTRHEDGGEQDDYCKDYYHDSGRTEDKGGEWLIVHPLEAYAQEHEQHKHAPQDNLEEG